MSERAARVASNTEVAPQGVLKQAFTEPDVAGSSAAPGPTSAVDGQVFVTVDAPTRYTVSYPPTAGSPPTRLKVLGDFGGASAVRGDVFDVAWSPSGDQFVYHRAGDTESDYWADATANMMAARGGNPNAQSTWSPLGDSILFGGNRAANAGTSQSWFDGRSASFAVGTLTGTPDVSPYGDVVVSAMHPEDDPTGWDVGFQELAFPATAADMFGTGEGALTLGAYQAREPRVSLAPGATLSDPTPEILVYKGLVPGTSDPYLWADYGTGPPPSAVVGLGAICDYNQLAVSPSHTKIAYLKAVGPAGNTCSQTELWVITGVAGTYQNGTETKIATSPVGQPFRGPSWKATTPAAAAMRVGGRDRTEVAVNSSQLSFPDAHTAQVAVVAGSTAYADALAGTPLAAQASGPMLFSGRSVLDPRTKAEVDRALVATGGTVYVLGGPGTLSAAVEAALAKAGRTVVRLGGASRFDVAVAIAEEIGVDSLENVFVADGTNWPDALVAGPAAALMRGAVVLSSGGTLPVQTEELLDLLGFREPPDTANGIGGVWAVGGAAIRATQGRPDVAELGGANRYEVEAAVAERFWAGESVVALADGRNWPDAVSGGATMALLRQPIHLSTGTGLYWRVRNHMVWASSSADLVVAFGGTASVSDSAVAAARSAAGRQTVVWGPDMP